MKIHIPEFKAMAKCNAHLDHAAFDLEIPDEELSKAGYVKVVRCKDCEHNHWELEPCHGKTIHYCNAFGFKIDITDALHEFFCGYGEPKGERRESE